MGPLPITPSSRPPSFSCPSSDFGRDLARPLQQNHVVGSVVGPPGEKRAGRDCDVTGAAGGERFGGGRGERRILLERDHARGELAEHGGGIAGGAADIEHVVGRGDPGGLQQLGKHHRLDQRA